LLRWILQSLRSLGWQSEDSSQDEANSMTTSSDAPAVFLRPMRLEDLDQVHVIDGLSFSLPWPASAFRYELVENPHSLVLVAELEMPDGERRIAGMVVVWQILDEAHVATIAVHPDFRGQHIGRSLLVAALKDAIRQGAKSATLEVRANNAVAQSLYRSLRFDVVGRRPRYYRDNNEDALLMTVDFRPYGEKGEAFVQWLDEQSL
jgi:[ribosomal protein S18]-alanine N-acetyltransferase